MAEPVEDAVGGVVARAAVPFAGVGTGIGTELRQSEGSRRARKGVSVPARTDEGVYVLELGAEQRGQAERCEAEQG